jgi:SAM-dependent methyltransferase
MTSIGYCVSKVRKAVVPKEGPNTVEMRAEIQRTLKKVASHLSRKPCVEGNERITGSFPPYGALCKTGRRDNYYIHDGYQHRIAEGYFDDSANSDEWQDEVYRFAFELAGKNGFRKILDIGCGSGYKLLKYFDDFETIGVDVAKTCARLRKRHPDRQWVISDFSQPAGLMGIVDLVIASDVIEHLSDPDALLQWVLRVDPSYLVLSTPDRNLLRYGTHNGPPRNPMHTREWSMTELHAYVADSFEIVEHFISSAPQATQCLLARPRARPVKIQ